MSQDALYLKAMDAINQLFGDTSVERSETKSNLESLAEQVETMLDALDDVE